MTVHAFVIFPDMDTTAVERFRQRWDPRAGEVPAHLTIGFPFDWPGPVAELEERLTPVVAAHPAFPLRLTSLEPRPDGYLFLLLGEGREQVRRLHEAVYALAIPGMRLTAPFEPHVTVGRGAAGGHRADELPLPIPGRATALTILARGADGRWARERELSLREPVPN